MPYLTIHHELQATMICVTLGKAETKPFAGRAGGRVEPVCSLLELYHPPVNRLVTDFGNRVGLTPHPARGHLLDAEGRAISRSGARAFNLINNTP